VVNVVVKGIVMEKMGSVKGKMESDKEIRRKIIRFSSDKVDVPDGVRFKKAEIIKRNINSSLLCKTFHM
jgi:hypothetical protein